MAKQPRNTRVSRRTPEPWDKWVERYLRIYAAPKFSANPAVKEHILAHASLACDCARYVRRYVDKAFTLQEYADKKKRGADAQRKVKAAIDGMLAAADLYRNMATTRLNAIDADRSVEAREYTHKAEFCKASASEFMSIKGNLKEAYNAKSHGRDRDHSFICRLYWVLWVRFGDELTYATLADLMNAGVETDAPMSQEIFAEDVIRKNLNNFQDNNPALNELIALNSLAEWTSVTSSAPGSFQISVRPPLTCPKP